MGTTADASLAWTNQHRDLTGTALTGSIADDPWGQPLGTTGTQADAGYQGGWTDPSGHGWLDCLEDVGYGAEVGSWLGPYGEAFGAFGGAVGGLLAHCNYNTAARSLPSNDYYDRPHGNDEPIDPVDHAVSPVSHSRTNNTPDPHSRTTVLDKRKPVYTPPAPPPLSVIVQERVNRTWPNDGGSRLS